MKKSSTIKNQMIKPTKYGNLTSTLVIVESPAKCSKIESYLGDGYKCVASFGHLRQISSLESIDTQNNFATKYDIIDDPKKRKHVDTLQTYISNATEVVLATDADREGEAIAWHICMLFGLPVETTKRIIFHEITETAIQYAIHNPVTINMNLVYSQQSRQILDMLVGYTITPLLWKYVSRTFESSLSAGRCQTPALRLIYDNHQEINRSPGQQVYHTIGYFTNKCIPFELDRKYESGPEITDYLNNASRHPHIYSCSSPIKVFKTPPEPLTTSRIQQQASNTMHISPKETMQYCQVLYDAGYITYMRTDSKKYSAVFINQVKDRISRTYNDDRYISPTINDMMQSEKKEKESGSTPESGPGTDSGIKSQEAHEAIRPTNINTLDTELPENIAPRERRLYKLIWTIALESCMSSAEYYSITSTIPSYNGTKYSKVSELPYFMGWKIVEHNNNKRNEEEEEYHYLHKLVQGNAVSFTKITSTVSMSKLKSHYSEARLVQLLEDRGIGRPSTFSSLIDKIQQREYVKKEDIKGVQIQCTDFELSGDTNEITKTIISREFGNEKSKLVIQPVGIIVIEFLMKHFDSLFNYEYTNLMETELDRVSLGLRSLPEICGTCTSLMNTQIQKLNDDGEKKCEIKIDDSHFYIIGKHGPTIKCIDNKNDGISFKPVKKNIDLAKLERGEYSIADIIKCDNTNNSITLGKYNGDDLILKRGKFGLYVSWLTQTKSLALFGNRPIENIGLDEVLEILKKDELGLESSTPVNTNIIRNVTDNISIRKGPKGNYIFFKTTKMKRPQFFKLDGFTEDIHQCDSAIFKKWIFDTYHIV